MLFIKHSSYVALLAGLLILAGCSEESETERASTNTTKEAPQKGARIKEQPATDKPKKKDKETSSVNGSKEEKILALVNKARSKGCNCGGKYYAPAPPVSWNNKLERAAKKHSRYMNRKNLLTHTGKGSTNPGERIKKEGYDWITFGENVASGYANETEAINGWLKSKGHCKNIMNPKFREMGVARSGAFWTQCFGAR